MLTETEKKVLASIQDDIPITERPYYEMAVKAGLSEEIFLETMQNLVNRSVIRRFGATIRHQKSGFEANAMTAWKVDEARINEVGEIMASCRHVSHCYRRNPQNDWPYNLYTMIHAKDKPSCRAIAQKLAEQTDVEIYTLLFSHRELKKTSMRYFS
ncbi:Lrp/AsnC family transcriptional regulator [Desulfococcaceae bacterium HSG9]|nr:Lrp/AsnC family transcriptional regulator [Desulfococcaceae bacterium HSG9]